MKYIHIRAGADNIEDPWQKYYIRFEIYTYEQVRIISVSTDTGGYYPHLLRNNYEVNRYERQFLL